MPKSISVKNLIKKFIRDQFIFKPDSATAKFYLLSVVLLILLIIQAGLIYYNFWQPQKNLFFQTLTSRQSVFSTSPVAILNSTGKSDKNQVLNLLFFGDIMLDRNVKNKITVKGFDYLLENLAGNDKSFFKGFDLVGANLEGDVTNKGEHYSPVFGNDFAFAPLTVKKLQNYYFNFFNLANNHLGDQGSRGITETRNNLTDLHFAFAGCADSQTGECSTTIMELKGKKIGLAGFSMVYHPINLIIAQRIIKELKAKTDLVVINVHWGSEYQHQFSLNQQAIAHGLIEAGADVIIGHHPHVIQGLEIYQGKPIFYSLGNFIFDQYFSADTQAGLAVSLSVDFSPDQSTKVSATLFPLASVASQVSLMKVDQKNKFLSNFSIWSKVDGTIKSQIPSGLLKL